MSRSSKKGPWVEDRLMDRIESMNASEHEDDDPHLVARVDDLPRDGRPHDRRPRRAQARARVRRRGDGRPQARRVRADAHLPRARLARAGCDEPRRAREPAAGRRPTRRKVAEEARGGKADAADGGRGRAGGRSPSARARRRPSREAEGQAAAETGVDKDAAEADRGEAQAPTRAEGRAQPGRHRARRRGRRRRRGRARTPQEAAASADRARAAAHAEPACSCSAQAALRAHLRPQGAAGVRPHPRQGRRRGAGHPGLHAARAAAKPWLKLLESAVANAEHNHELVGEELKIAAVHADEGPTLKRFRPRAMGRATRIRKRTSHLTITLTPKESRTYMGQKVHPEAMRVGLHPRLEVELVLREELLRLPDRGRPHPRPHHGQARPRRPVGHHDPQGRRRGGGQHPHGAPGHRDRQVRAPRSTPCAATCTG